MSSIRLVCGCATGAGRPAADDHGGEAGGGAEGEGWVMIEVEHVARRGQAGRLARGGGLGQGGHPVRQRGLQRLGAGALGHQRQQLLDGQDRVATYWMMIGLPL
jgi:hypothetical protein